VRARPKTLSLILVIAGMTSVPVLGARAGADPPDQVTVEPGDTLSGIAAELGVSATALASENDIDDADHIEAGQVLDVPGGGSASRYTVLPGDTLTAVAARHGVSIAAIVEANDLSSPNLIVIGSTLVIPAGDDSSSSTGLPSRLLADPARMALLPVFDQWASEYHVPADLLKGMTWLESGWQNDVVSSAGAVGIGQLMPDTIDLVRDVLLDLPLDPTDPEDNIRMAARYLRYLLDRCGGDAELAVASYYQGFASIQRSGIFESTQHYVEVVVTLRERF
jgi:LysM repeat protein